jgi:hypothetical protein
MRDHAQPFSPHSPWSSWFSLCGIMQENLDLPGGERKEGLMIRVLAQIISRQIRTPKEGIREEPDPPPARCPTAVQTVSIASAGPSAKASTRGMETPAAGNWPDQPTQGLVVLFTKLAQRHVQAARAQEETHEYSSHHPSSSRTDGLRLRAPIHPVASE